MYEHIPDAAPSRSHQLGRRTTLVTRARRIWPLLLVPLVAFTAWQLRAPTQEQPSLAPTTARLSPRTFDGLTLAVPPEWKALERTRDHIAWGSADRSHTVTLAATEASLLPLPGVVAAVAEESASALPGARMVGRGTTLELGSDAAPKDAAILARFEVAAQDGGTLEIQQVWRRDTRAGLDVVATWTSSDGRWPAPPRASIPHATASR